MIRLIALIAVITAIAGAVGSLPAVAADKPLTLATLQALVDDGQYAAALAQTEPYLDRHPGNRDARFLRAVALAGLGRNKDAIEAFRTLARDWPDRPEPANNLAALYARQGDYEKAREWLVKALNTQTVYAVAHRNLGDVYTALATMAYSQVLDSDADTGNEGMQLALVDHLSYPSGVGLLLPQTTAPAARDAADATQVATAEPTAPKTEPAPPVAAPQQERTPAEPAPEEPAPDPQQPDPQQPDPQPAVDSRIVQAVHDWAQAWSSQDYDAYIGYYTNDFSGDEGQSREQWLAERKVRVTQKASIDVQVMSPEVRRIDDDSARVTFIQTYESRTYSDKVRKWLLMERTDQGWRIARETSTLLSRG